MYNINGVNYLYNTQPNIIYTNIPNKEIYLNNINNPSAINNDVAEIIYNLNQPKILNNNYDLQNDNNFNNLQIVNNNTVNNNNNNINSYYNSNNYPQNIQYLTNVNTITNNNENNTNYISETNNVNALVPSNQEQNNTNKSSIQSNDFWQKIDNRKLSHNQGLNSSPQNTLNTQNTNNNNNNSDPMNQVLDDFFRNFFNNETPNHQITTNQVQINMGQPAPGSEPHMYFHSFFLHLE